MRRLVVLVAGWWVGCAALRVGGGGPGSRRGGSFRRVSKTKLRAAAVQEGPFFERSAAAASEEPSTFQRKRRRFLRAVAPRWTAVDGRIAGVALPSIVGLMVFPVVGAVDTCFVGRMADAVALAGAGAANSAFSCIFFSLAALPTLTAPLVARAFAAGDDAAVRRSVADAILVAAVLGGLGTMVIRRWPGELLGAIALDPSAPAFKPAKAYLRARALGFAPALVSSTCFAVYRGLLDTRTPLKVSVAYNLLNAVLDPILIFGCGLGVVGAAVATAWSEFLGAALYLLLLRRRGVFVPRLLAQAPDLRALARLFRGGASMQARQVCLNGAFASASRMAQALDATGVQAAAYAISQQFWLVCGVSLFALQSSAAALVPSVLASREDFAASATTTNTAESPETAARNAAQTLADRALAWGASP